MLDVSWKSIRCCQASPSKTPLRDYRSTIRHAPDGIKQAQERAENLARNLAHKQACCCHELIAISLFSGGVNGPDMLAVLVIKGFIVAGSVLSHGDNDYMMRYYDY